MIFQFYSAHKFLLLLSSPSLESVQKNWKKIVRSSFISFHEVKRRKKTSNGEAMEGKSQNEKKREQDE